VTVHAHVGGRPNGLAVLRKILGALTVAEDCWVALRREVAAIAREARGDAGTAH
jgi:hypothetical protein